MNITSIKEAIMLCHHAGVTPYVWGHRGVGKSSIVDQCAEKHRMGSINMRLSQCEASDLRGMPYADVSNGVTRFLPPVDMPIGGISWDEYMDILKLPDSLIAALGETEAMNFIEADPTIVESPLNTIRLLDSLIEIIGEKNKDVEVNKEIIDKLGLNLKPGNYLHSDFINSIVGAIKVKMSENRRRLNNGFLFLDELNRAQDDVTQAAFELVLDNSVGSYNLPPGWSVVCAGNFNDGDSYQTNNFKDAALIDRFAHLTLDSGEITVDEWTSYMVNQHGGKASKIIEFATQNTNHLDGSPSGSLGFNVEPSRRSWEAVVRVNDVMLEGNYSKDAYAGIISGLLGQSIATSYINYDCPVNVKGIMSNGVTPYMDDLRRLSRNQLQGVTWGLASYLKGKVNEEKYAKIAIDYAKFVLQNQSDNDIIVAFITMLVDIKMNHIRMAAVSNPKVAQLIHNLVSGSGNNKKPFISYLQDHPEFQDILSSSALGLADINENEDED